MLVVLFLLVVLSPTSFSSSFSYQGNQARLATDHPDIVREHNDLKAARKEAVTQFRLDIMECVEAVRGMGPDDDAAARMREMEGILETEEAKDAAAADEA